MQTESQRQNWRKVLYYVRVLVANNDGKLITIKSPVTSTMIHVNIYEGK